MFRASYHLIITDHIQSETSSLVTRTPTFAAPKSSVGEVGPVMLSSLPAQRYPDDNYDIDDFYSQEVS